MNLTPASQNAHVPSNNTMPPPLFTSRLCHGGARGYPLHAMPLSGYSGTPLVKKLGIKPGTTVALLAAPPNFEAEWLDLPGDVRVTSRIGREPEMVIWFVRARRDLDRRVKAVSRTMGP